MRAAPAPLRIPLLCAAALSALAAGAAGQALRVGFAHVDITPDVEAGDVWMAGFGQGRKATGVHDPLGVRALVFEAEGRRVALVSADVIGLFRESVQRIRARVEGFEHVLVASTHNHEGPDTMGLWGPGPMKSGVDPAYLERVEAAAAQAVRAAAAALEPAVAYYASARAPALIADGRLPVAIDDELRALLLRSKRGLPLAVAVQWSCHPETLGSRNTLVSSDFPHAVRMRLEERLACPVIYFNGAIGGMMTSLGLDVRDEEGKLLEGGTFEKTERYGELVAELADQALTRLQPIRLTPFEVRVRELFVPQDNKGYAAMFALGVVRRDAFAWKGGPDEAEPLESRVTLKRVAVQTEVGVLRLGELTLVSVPGELYPELATGAIQEPQDPGADFQGAEREPCLLPALGERPRMILGLANDELGYILPRSQWDVRAPFCYGREKAQYGESNSLGPETAPILMRALAELLAGDR